MDKNPITPKIDKLRRNQRIVKQQIETRTAELERANKSLEAEIAQHKRTEEELRLLIRIAREITAANDFLSAVNIVLRRICESTGWAVGEAWVPCSDGTALQYSHAWYGESKSLERFKELSGDFRFRPGVGLPGRVWLSKQAEWVPDLSAEPEDKYPRYTMWKDFGFESALGIPIITNARTVAVLVFFMSEAREEDKRSVEIVSAVAVQLGSTLRHKQSEQALREREALLQHVIDESTNIIWVKDSEGRHQFINRKFEQLFGISREQVNGKTDYDLFPAHIADNFRANDLKVIEAGASMEFEERAPQKDGMHTYVSNKFPMRDANGNVYAVCGIATDITEHKRAEDLLELRVQERTAELLNATKALQAEIAERKTIEEQLVESQERYRVMADATPVLIWQSGPDKLCTYFNSGWLEFTGRSIKQELGNGWADGVHPDDLQKCLDIYTSAFERREPFMMEYRLRHRSGEYRWVLDRGAPAHGTGGTFQGYIGGCIDIHDLKLAEERLRRAFAFNQAIMANMGEGLYTLDTRGLVTYVNPAAERLFGWSSAELLGRKMHDVTHYQHPDGRPFPADECAGLQVLKRGMTLSDHEDVFIRKDGTFFPVVYSSSPIAPDGGIVGLVVAFRDMTAQKHAEEALNKSREELRALAARLQAAREEERTELARDIHDELSGNLTALKMDLSLLPDRAARGHRPFLEKLSSMSGLIDRSLARVHTIVTELRPVVLDKLGLVAAIEWLAGEFQDRSGVTCQIHLPTDDILLDSDRSTAVFRIFQEALTNVARHAHATRVIVNLKREAGGLILTVRDNGKGIDEKAIQAHNSIGLLGMRERAMALGGETEVTTVPGGGTLVTVRVPIEQHAPAFQ